MGVRSTSMPLAARALGFTVALAALWGRPISGASMSPARSLGPTSVAACWTISGSILSGRSLVWYWVASPTN